MSDHSEFGINHGAGTIIGGGIGGASSVGFGVGVSLPGIGSGGTSVGTVPGGGSNGNVSNKHAITRLKHANSVSIISFLYCLLCFCVAVSSVCMSYDGDHFSIRRMVEQKKMCKLLLAELN